MVARRKMTFFRIGFIPDFQGLPHSSERPLVILMASEPYSRPFYITQGVGHGLMGGFYTPAEVVKEQTFSLFEECECEWAIPLAAQGVNGKELSDLIKSKTGNLIEQVVDVKI